MKKKLICILLILLISLSLTSCGFNTGNYFIEGVFYSSKNSIADDDEDANVDYEHAILTITKIDEQTFLDANGLNVVKDVSGFRIGDYFLIELLVFSKEKNDYIQLNYYNLRKREHVHANTYVDNGFHYITPRESKQYKNDSCKYDIGYNGYYAGFYVEKTANS